MRAKIISKIIYDDDTGIPFLEDVRGNIHMAGDWGQAVPLPPTRNYLQTLSYLEFPDTENFHSIPNSLTGELKTEYIVPPNKQWKPAFIMAAQDLLGRKESKGMSIIGVYLNNRFIMAVPFKHEMHYILYEPLTFFAGATLELKLMPSSKDTRVCILVGGELRDMD